MIMQLKDAPTVPSPKTDKPKRQRNKRDNRPEATAENDQGEVITIKGPTLDIAKARLAVLVLPLGARAGGAGHIIGRVLAACGVTDRKAALPELPELADRLEGLDPQGAMDAAESIFTNWSDPKTISRSRLTLGLWLEKGRHTHLAKHLRVIHKTQSGDFSVTISPPNGGKVTHTLNVVAELNDIAGFKATTSRLFKAADSGHMA